MINYLFYSIIIGSVLIQGCVAARMVVSPGGPSESKYAPENEPNRPGIVTYQNSRWQGEARRKDAYRQMYESCNGKYRIKSERADQKVVGQNSLECVYIEFECVDK